MLGEGRGGGEQGTTHRLAEWPLALPRVCGQAGQMSWAHASCSAGVLGWDPRGLGTQQGVLLGSEALPTGLTHQADVEELAAPCKSKQRWEPLIREGKTQSNSQARGRGPLTHSVPGKRPGLQEGTSQRASRRRGSKGTATREAFSWHMAQACGILIP